MPQKPCDHPVVDMHLCQLFPITIVGMYVFQNSATLHSHPEYHFPNHLHDSMLKHAILKWSQLDPLFLQKYILSFHNVPRYNQLTL